MDRQRRRRLGLPVATAYVASGAIAGVGYATALARLVMLTVTGFLAWRPTCSSGEPRQ